MTGRIMLERLFRAADRGVRVRLLLDDLGTMPSDEVLVTIDSHPNIEVRMFNPVAWRSLRLLGIAADLDLEVPQAVGGAASIRGDVGLS